MNVPGGMGSQPQMALRVVQNTIIMMASLDVIDSPDGSQGKMLQFVLPNGTAYTFPLDPTAVELLMTKLKGSPVTVARMMPPGL